MNFDFERARLKSIAVELEDIKVNQFSAIHLDDERLYALINLHMETCIRTLNNLAFYVPDSKQG